jgi:hypothetical protein
MAKEPSMIAKPLYLWVLMAAASVPAADRVPPPGSYAFNWLDPDSQCKALTDEDLARITSCEPNDNAFGLSLPSLACKVDPDTELMVYTTEARCQEALETMQANGP